MFWSSALTGPLAPEERRCSATHAGAAIPAQHEELGHVVHVRIDVPLLFDGIVRAAGEQWHDQITLPDELHEKSMTAQGFQRNRGPIDLRCAQIDACNRRQPAEARRQTRQRPEVE